MFFSQPILGVLAPNVSSSFHVENNDYGLLYLSNGKDSKQSNDRYLYPPINVKTDIAFTTTNVFAEKFGINTDVNLLCMTASRSSMITNKSESKLVFIAIIPEMRNNESKTILSDDIWTDDFQQFESMISEFPAQASMLSIHYNLL